MKILLLLSMVFMVSCLKNEIQNGTVIHKEILPEHSETRLEYNVVLKMPMTVMDNYETKYLIVIKKDTSFTRVVEVSKQYYDYVTLGTFVEIK